jgi:hypothetical protein
MYTQMHAIIIIIKRHVSTFCFEVVVVVPHSATDRSFKLQVHGHLLFLLSQQVCKKNKKQFTKFKKLF